jgi:3-methyladenine DNA glycosylase AlkD
MTETEAPYEHRNRLRNTKTSSNENFIKIYQKQRISEIILGVMNGPIRKLADQIKTDHRLALVLWGTNIYEARILAISIMDPAQIFLAQLKAMVQSSKSLPVIDELTLDYFKESQILGKLI